MDCVDEGLTCKPFARRRHPSRPHWQHGVVDRPQCTCQGRVMGVTYGSKSGPKSFFLNLFLHLLGCFNKWFKAILTRFLTHFGPCNLPRSLEIGNFGTHTAAQGGRMGMQGGGGGGGQGTWASQKHSEAGDGQPVDRGVWTAKTVKRPRQQPAHPQYANYWAPLTRKRHTMPHSAQPRHTNHWAPRMRKRHQQEHRPQRPTESIDPTQHAKGRTGGCPGPRKGATTRRNVTQGAGGGLH